MSVYIENDRHWTHIYFLRSLAINLMWFSQTTVRDGLTYCAPTYGYLGIHVNDVGFAADAFGNIGLATNQDDADWFEELERRRRARATRRREVLMNGEDSRVTALREALGDDFDYAVRTLQRDPRLVNAYTVDIIIRKDGSERRFEADWLKRLARLVERTTARPLGEMTSES